MASEQPFATRDEAMTAFAQHVSAGKVEVFRSVGFDLVMGQRQGSWFTDAYDGRRLLNAHCNGGVFNLGHRNPRVVEAVRAALDDLDLGNHHLISGHRAALARRLAATTGGDLAGAVFGVSGGEAIDLAIKVVRAVTGRHTIVSVQGGYHGHTGLAMAAGDPQYRDPFGPQLPGFVQVPFDDVGAMAAAMDESVAGVLLEPIPATLGMPIPADGYLAEVGALCTGVGAKLIVDEVQTGLGRTGRMWGYQHDDVRPDALVTGKGLSGGIYPITATLLSDELLALFARHPFVHISTAGGSEIGCAAANAVLDIVEDPGFLPRVDAVAARFGAALGGGHGPYSLRQRGLMMALRFGGEGAGMMAAKMMIDAGVFCVWANNDTAALQLLPPLTITDDEVTTLIETIGTVFR